MISIVIPVYMGESMVSDLCEEIFRCTQDFDSEIVLVNDSSPDNSWSVIADLCKSNNRIKGINLSRNYGQHPAIFAGLSESKGEIIIVMDCDFQDNPLYIPELIKELNKGYDIVLAKRIERKEVLFKRLMNKLFYYSLSYFTNLNFDGSIGNYGAYRRKVIDAAISIPEYFKVFSFTIRWLGYRSSTIEVKHGQRINGRSSYSIKTLLILAENIILTFSNKPLIITIRVGLFLSVASIIFAIYYIGFLSESGFSLVNGIILFSTWFLSGLILFSLGLVGLYIGKIFEAQKRRPYFVISDKINL